MSVSVINDIVTLRRDYLQFLQDHNWHSLSELLTDEARFTSNTWVSSLNGSMMILEQVMQRSQEWGDGFHFHLHTPEVTITEPEQRAYGVWHASERLVSRQSHNVSVRIGYVHDRYVRVDDRWKIEFSYFEVLTDDVLPNELWKQQADVQAKLRRKAG